MSNLSSRLYNFKPWVVRMMIPEGYKGTYTLYSQCGEDVVPIYVGRSDTDLRRRLVNHPFLDKADFFEFFIFDSPEKCFLSESALYHCLQDELQNLIHPASPASSNIKCPFCAETYNKSVTDRLVFLTATG